MNGQSIFDTDLQKETLECYYENLAIPKDDDCFDGDYLEHSEFHLSLIWELLNLKKESTTEPFTDKEVKVCTRVVRKVLRHSLFCQKDRTSVQTTFMVTKYYIYVILG